MKKLLLTLLVLIGMQYASANEYVYGICGDEIQGVGTGMAGSNYSAAIEVPEAVAKTMEGQKLTALNIGFKSGLNKIIYVYLTYDLEGEPFYQQEGRVKVNTFNEVVLDTPYIIEGKKFYIGYNYRQSSSTGYPIGFDGSDMGGMPVFSYLGMWPDGGTPEWTSQPKYGALSIRATIEGERKIDNCVIPVGLKLPKSTSLGKEFTYTFDVLNYGNSPVSDITISSVLGATGVNETEYHFAKALKVGERGTITLAGSTNVEDNDFFVNVSVPTVNGNDNLWASLAASGQMIASDFVFPRVIVIEEGTGTGCGWCVAGYAALEQMRENHPEDYIGIAVHNYSGDPMHCASYEPWDNRYVTGYPTATISRVGEGFAPSPTACESRYNELAGMMTLFFNIEAEYTDDSKTSVRTRTYLRPGSDLDNCKYAVALVETEDNVGPYSQRNYYSGGSNGPMYGFENQSEWVSLMYNDVARGIYNWLGNPESLPSTMKESVLYTYDETIPVKTPSNKLKDANYIALLIDRSNGQIVTAAKCKPDRIGAGVEGVNPTPEARVRVIDGGISVIGAFDRTEVYSLDGRLCATLANNGEVGLPAGMYIVRVCDGTRTFTNKVIVK